MEAKKESQVKLTKNQSAAIRSEMQDIAALQLAVSKKIESYQRFVTAIVLDAGGDPKQFMNAGLWEEGGVVYLRPQEG